MGPFGFRKAETTDGQAIEVAESRFAHCLLTQRALSDTLVTRKESPPRSTQGMKGGQAVNTGHFLG